MRYREILEGWGEDPYNDYDNRSDHQREWDDYKLKRKQKGYRDDADMPDHFIYEHYALKDLPHYEDMVHSGKFIFEDRHVISLEGAPERVHEFDCRDNYLESLEFAPKYVEETFDCSDNDIASFEGGPVEVGNFTSHKNPVTSLKGSPRIVHEMYAVSCDTPTRLQSYEGAPQQAKVVMIPLIGDGSFRVLKEGFPNIEMLMLQTHNGQNFSHVLSLFQIAGLKRIAVQTENPTYREGFEIVRKYLPMGKKGMMTCAAELVKLGLKDWAKQ